VLPVQEEQLESVDQVVPQEPKAPLALPDPSELPDQPEKTETQEPPEAVEQTVTLVNKDHAESTVNEVPLE